MSAQIEVYFATNRNLSKNGTSFGKNFSEHGLSDLRYGKSIVSSEDIKIQIAEQSDDGKTLGSQDIMFDVKRQMEESKKDVMVFIHGFNTEFEEALRMAARVKQNFEARGKEIIMVVFSWPSDGRAVPWIDYGSDREDAKASGHAFARGVLKLLAFLRGKQVCGQKVHLMAHSMGNYVLRNMVQAMVQMAEKPRIFDSAFLMAADEDDDALEHDHKLLPFIDMCKKLYVYFNKHDRALAGADLTKGLPDRLGSHGPRYPNNIPHKVQLVDVSAVEDEIIDTDLNHSYLAYNDHVAKDLYAIITGANPHEMNWRTWDARKNKFRLKR